MSKKATLVQAQLVDVKGIGLSRRASLLLSEIISRKYTSPRELTELFSVTLARDATALSRAVKWVKVFLETQGVSILTDERKEELGLLGRFREERTRRAEVPEKKERYRLDGYLELVEEGFNESCLTTYLREVRRYPLLDHEAVCLLATKVREKSDIDARNTIIVHNLRLSAAVARRYVGRALDLLDLIQEGNIGLLFAAEKFDERRGFQFSTYAINWVKQMISRAIENHALDVRVPSHVQQKVARIRRISGVLVQHLGRDPTAEEIAQKTGFSLKEVNGLLRRARMSTVSFEDVITAAGEDGGLTLAESSLMRDSMTASPEEVVAAKETLKEKCLNVEALLTALLFHQFRERDIQVFCARYGLDGTLEVKTLEEIGQSLNRTRERVRQILARTWNTLRFLGYEWDEVWLLSQLDSIRYLEELAGEVSYVERLASLVADESFRENIFTRTQKIPDHVRERGGKNKKGIRILTHRMSLDGRG